MHPVRALACVVLLIGGVAGLGTPAYAQQPTAFEPGRAAFQVRVGDLDIPYRVFGLYVMPGEVLLIRPRLGGYHPAFSLTANVGKVQAQRVLGGRVRWRWRAPPSPGHYTLVIRSPRGDYVRLNVFVMRPLTDVKEGYLHRYRIGTYPQVPLDGKSSYSAPRGLIEVDETTRDLLVSPHFTLGQFLCKQEGGPPMYLALREPLLIKLESLLEAVNRQGYAARSLHVMSGYRTPSYNQSLGNAAYSRHIYGGAADIFVDESPRDGVMDDLNRDGSIDIRDAQWLSAIVESMDAAGQKHPTQPGGLGLYPTNPYHGPFIHVDVRGEKARW